MSLLPAPLPARHEAPAYTLVLTQRGSVWASAGIQGHQLALGQLVQRVECQPAPCVRDGRAIFPNSTIPTDEHLKRIHQLPAQLLTLKELPLVEGRAIGQTEARHELGVAELCSQLARGGALITQRVGRMAELLPGSNMRLKCCHVQPGIYLRIPGDLEPIHDQYILIQHCSEHRELAA
jgi:hypothetical protein